MNRGAAHPPLLGLLATLIVASLAVAQPQGEDGGPIVVGEPREKFQTIHFDRLDFFFDFFARYQRDERNSNSGPDTTDTEWLIRPTVGFSSRSFIGHRNLIDLKADASFGWQNEDIDRQSEGVTGTDTTTATFFDIEALVFGASAAPLTFYARRDETILERAFAGSIDSRVTEFGASARLFRNVAPTTIRIFHRDQEYGDRLGVVQDDTIQDTFSVQSLWTPNRSHRLSVDYSFDMISEDRGQRGGDDYQRNDATIIHTYRFGTKREHDLRSIGRFFDETGDRQQRLYRINETLTLRHSPRLESRYLFTAENRQVQNEDRTLFRGSAQVTKRIFESLVMTAETGGNHTNLSGEDFTSNEIFGRVQLEYIKDVPLGQFDASLTLGVNHRDDSERGQAISIIDRPGVFNDPFPVVLPGRNILENSIIVRDSTGSREFVEGRDYTVQLLPDRAEVRRVVGGLIADGELTRNDYSIGPSPAISTTSLIFTLATRYEIQEGILRGLAVYADFRDTSQDLDTTDPLITPSSLRAYRVGGEYRRRPFWLGAEYELHESSISPFNAVRLFARYDQRLGANSVLSLHASHDIVDFTDENNNTELTRILAEWRQYFSGGLDLRLRLLYRDESTSFGGDTSGFEQVFELNWIKRQTRIFVSIRNSFLESSNEDTLSQTFTFGLRRDF